MYLLIPLFLIVTGKNIHQFSYFFYSVNFFLNIPDFRIIRFIHKFLDILDSGNIYLAFSFKMRIHGIGNRPRTVQLF